MNKMRKGILQVSASDRMGGAEKVAHALFEGSRTRGYESWMAVGEKTGSDDSIFEIGNDSARPLWSRAMAAAGRGLAVMDRVRGVKRAQLLLRDSIGQPTRTARRNRGEEDFDFPATRELLEVTPRMPDLLHCHNLHSPRGYFDLRELPALCDRVPVMLTLHDAWLFSGHCAHSFECERWKTGCGSCPDLSIYPAIAADATAYNWRRKREILSRCRLWVSAPSRWLLEKAKQSILAESIVEGRVIANGVDLDAFKPGDQAAARAVLGLPARSKILLFAANGIRDNCFKDFATMRGALASVSEALAGEEMLFIALGEHGHEERIGSATIRFVPFENEASRVAAYYQAADVYVHAAKADTFPTTVLEAMACGRAVVASRVGGIPEQIEHGVSGLLTPVGDPNAMAKAILQIMTNAALCQAMGRQGAEIARKRFDVRSQVDAYVGWYDEIISGRGGCAAR